MKIAITGATGFIGKILVEKHLQIGDQVHILTRKNNSIFANSKNINVHQGDLTDLKTLFHFVENTDVLYHCAAEIKDEKEMQKVNVEGTKNLIEAAILGKVKHWVQLSSVGVYGPIQEGIVEENQPYNPINEYEKTKLSSDFLVKENAKNNFTYTFVRPSNVIGAEMPNQSIFQLIKVIDKGLYCFLGEKGASANYIPVENVVEALYLAAIKEEAKNQIFIISNWCTIENFVGLIAQQLHKKEPKIRVPVKLMKLLARLTAFIPFNPLTEARVNALSNKAIYSNRKIENELAYQPIVALKSSLEKMVEVYKNAN